VAEIPAAVATAAAMAADIPATAVDTQATAVPIASPPATAALITRASGGSIRQFKIGPKILKGPVLRNFGPLIIQTAFTGPIRGTCRSIHRIFIFNFLS